MGLNYFRNISPSASRFYQLNRFTIVYSLTLRIQLRMEFMFISVSANPRKTLRVKEDAVLVPDGVIVYKQDALPATCCQVVSTGG